MTTSAIGAAEIHSPTAPATSVSSPSLESPASNISWTLEAADPALKSPAPVPQPGILVSLGSSAAPDVAYANFAQTRPSVAWSEPPTDSLGKLMEGNFGARSKSGALSSLLNGLGSELLGGLSTTKGNLQRSVAAYSPNYRGLDGDAAAGGVTAADALQGAKNVANRINLKIQTASGKTVDISISFGGDRKGLSDSLSIDMKTSGELSEAEQQAIAKLATGFDAALRGIAGESGKVDLAGLVSFDSTVLSSIDLSVRGSALPNGLQSLDFHADLNRRSFAMEGQLGKLSVNVDLTSPAPLGNAAQREAAVKKFLDQFDAANTRAHGEVELVGQFKDVFAQLNSSYPPPETRPAPSIPAWVLSAEDQAELSGLADFQASMSGEFDNGLQDLRATEAGKLDYQVSQRTRTQGVAKSSGVAVEQTQRAILDTTLDRGREGRALNKESGNYDRFSIRDESVSTTSFEYADFHLKSASIASRLDQTEKYEKLVDHKVVDSRVTPRSLFNVEDISGRLERWGRA